MESTIYKPSIYKDAGIYKTGAGGGGGGGVPGDYLPIEKISIPFNKNQGGVLLEVETNNAAAIEINCFIDYSFTTWGDLFILMLYNANTEKGGVRCNPQTKELYGSNQNVSFGDMGYVTESVYRLKLDKDKLTLNNSLYSIYYSKQSITAVSLGCAGAAGRRSYPYDVFGVKITDEENNVILDGIPVKRIEDNIEGIFDLISSRFFVNNV